MNIGDKMHGFLIKRVRPITELNAELVEMTHEKTDLELVWIKRNEENKIFGIAFRTFPEDDTGVFHILEHSVLNGSEKYRVKEPFVELLKNSMNTFLNAMTFPDKTYYPISSRNSKDFQNLMDVYLDAVFFPRIYQMPEIFYQEGWHYEIDSDGRAGYKGVVFNEMKGALAGADSLEENALMRALFPDNCYRYISGGDPASIPDLSYDTFVQTHKRFYSPSNAIIFLDGDLDIDRTLEHIDSGFLSRLEKGERIRLPRLQNAVDGGVTEERFELGEDEEADGKKRIAWGTVIGEYSEREKIVAMQILSDVLCGSNQSLLSKPILSKGLAEDVVMQVLDGIYQPCVKLELQNVREENTAEAEKLAFETLERLARDGIDRSQIEASMANLEFSMRERDYGTMPQGLIFSFNILDSFLYGGDPAANLEVGSLFETLKKKAANGYFEELINKYILNNPHRAKVIMIPSHEAGEERRRKEQERLERESASWSDEERQRLIESQERLEEWQNSEDTREQLNALPRLRLSDISPKPENLPTEVGSVGEVNTLYHDINCAGIANFSVFFDADDLTEQEICELSFLTDILGKMRTEKHTEEELDRELRLVFGALNFYFSVFEAKNRKDSCKCKLTASFGVLEKNVDRALEMVSEILTQTVFDNEETAFNLLKQLKNKYLQNIIMSGSGVGVGRVCAYYSAAGVANECAGGFAYYRWLCSREKERDWPGLKLRLESLIEKLVCKNRMTVSLTGGSRELLKRAAEKLSRPIKQTGDREELRSKIRPWGSRREGIAVPSDVSFACAGNVLTTDKAYNGSMRIASRIASLSYLWNVIRVQGGAYGAGFTIGRNKLATCYSYRDPDAAASLEAYKGIAGFIKDFCKDESCDLSGFIIGAISNVSPLLTPKGKGFAANSYYWSEISDEQRQISLREMLEADRESVIAAADCVEGLFDSCGVCVVGPREALEKCGLDSIEML